MAQHDYVIDNSTGANVRADINNALQAIVTNNSGSSAPSSTFPFMLFADTSAGTMKIRNAADNAFIELFQLDGTFTLEDGSASTPALAFRDDLNTGIFSSAADTFNVATGGVERMELGTTTIFNEDGADVDFRIEGDSEANLFYVDAGNNHIGINDSTPSVTLDITGEGGGNGEVHVKRTSGASCFIQAQSGTAVFGSNTNHAVSFKSNSTTALTIDTSQRVGIGTTSPSLSLDVQGANNTTFDNLGTIGLSGTDAFNSGNAGSGINFNGKFNSSGNITTLAQISGIKADTGDGTFDGVLTFGVRNDALGVNIEKMRLDSLGKLLLGTTTDVAGGAPLQVIAASASSIFLGNSNTNASGNIDLQFAPSNNVTTSIIRGYAIEDASSASEMTGGLKFFIRENANFKEAVRLDREGNFTMAEAIDFTTAKFSVAHSGNNGVAGVPTFISRFEQKTDNTGTDHACILLKHAAAQSGQDGIGMLFLNSGGSEVGELNIGQSTVGLQSNSDYRLKENAIAISDGITRLKTLKPYRFNFIDDPDRTVDGFFAHEVTAVPEAISGTKDQTKNVLYTERDTIPDGKAVGDVKEVVPVYQGIDQSKLVPLLVAAVQELIGKVEALEAA